MVNILGVRKGAYLMNLLTAIKFVALIAVCTLIFIFARGSTGNFFAATAAPAANGGLLGRFGLALVAVLWAYKGWETGTYSAGEMRDPRKKLPLGLFDRPRHPGFFYLAAPAQIRSRWRRRILNTKALRLC